MPVVFQTDKLFVSDKKTGGAGFYYFADVRNPPANRLEELSVRRNGQEHIRIEDWWAACFEYHERIQRKRI